jgi:hypothetical protein
MKIINTARIALALRLLLGGVFIFSAISKLVSVGVFEIAVVDQGLAATREQAAYPARLVIAFELFLGASLLFPKASFSNSSATVRRAFIGCTTAKSTHAGTRSSPIIFCRRSILALF